MDIDISSIIIGIVALSFFFAPVIYYEYYKKRPTKKFTAHFKKTAEKHHLNLTQFDVWRDHYGIGIDNDRKKIIYFIQKYGQEKLLLLDLAEIKKCRKSKEDYRLKTPDGYKKITTRIELQFEFLTHKKSDASIEFYKGESEQNVRDEVMLAEKWSKIINSKLSKK
jgi:hypothetical protein